MGSLGGNFNLFKPGSSGGGGGSIPVPLEVFLPFKHIIRDKHKERRWETDKDTKIPEGWYFLDIYNSGLNTVKIEVYGHTEVISPGGRWHSTDKIDWEHYQQELGPPIIVYASGETVWIHVCYPSDNPTDVTTI
ncbi:MAG TPA: hypothetical protein PK006_12355 [Saprospiraceae bacterium]|nr:hypothetical protein [Saprospiraceae bacterium]